MILVKGEKKERTGRYGFSLFQKVYLIRRKICFSPSNNAKSKDSCDTALKHCALAKEKKPRRIEKSKKKKKKRRRKEKNFLTCKTKKKKIVFCGILDIKFARRRRPDKVFALGIYLHIYILYC